MKNIVNLCVSSGNASKLSADDLNQGVADDYSYILNQINKFEKIMKNNDIFCKDCNYMEVRNSLIKSFKKFHLYMESCCSELDSKVGHYNPKTVSVSGDLGIFEARRELNQEYSRIVSDISIFDSLAEDFGINVFSRDYIHKKRDLEKSFEDYYSVVNSRLRNGEF